MKTLHKIAGVALVLLLAGAAYGIFENPTGCAFRSDRRAADNFSHNRACLGVARSVGPRAAANRRSDPAKNRARIGTPRHFARRTPVRRRSHPPHRPRSRHRVHRRLARRGSTSAGIEPGSERNPITDAESRTRLDRRPGADCPAQRVNRKSHRRSKRFARRSARHCGSAARTRPGRSRRRETGSDPRRRRSTRSHPGDGQRA